MKLMLSTCSCFRLVRNINCHKCYNFSLLCFYFYYIFHFCSLSYHFLAGEYFHHWYIFGGCQQTKPVKSERFGIKKMILLFSLFGFIYIWMCVPSLASLTCFRLLGFWASTIYIVLYVGSLLLNKTPGVGYCLAKLQ